MTDVRFERDALERCFNVLVEKAKKRERCPINGREGVDTDPDGDEPEPPEIGDDAFVKAMLANGYTMAPPVRDHRAFVPKRFQPEPSRSLTGSTAQLVRDTGVVGAGCAKIAGLNFM